MTRPEHAALQFPAVLVPGVPSAPWLDADVGVLAEVKAAVEAELPAICAEAARLCSRRPTTAARSTRSGAGASAGAGAGAGGSAGAGAGADGFMRQPEKEVPRTGDWHVAYLYHMGEFVRANCERCPRTAAVIRSIPRQRHVLGYSGFSVLSPGSEVNTHCDPHNLRARLHFGISVPPGDARIRVGTETRRWKQHGTIAFDDSFDHETYNHTAQPRVVFILDVWHPSLTDAEIALLQVVATDRACPLRQALVHHNGTIQQASQQAQGLEFEDVFGR